MSTSARLPHHPEAAITADPQIPAIRIERDFAATPAQLMRAHTEADLFVQWCGPSGATTRILDWDARTLGSYRYVCVDDGTDHVFRGTFPEISETRLVQTFCYEPMPEAVSLEITTFTDLSEGRTRLQSQSLYDSFESRDAMLVSGMDTGVNDGYAALDVMLSDGAL